MMDKTSIDEFVAVIDEAVERLLKRLH